MKQLLVETARFATLALTCVLLVGHGGGPGANDACDGSVAPGDAEYAFQELTFDVTGDCGAPGQVTLTAPLGRCELTLKADAAVGLPHTGTRADSPEGDLRRGGWSAAGAPADGAPPVTCRADTVSAGAPVPVSCTGANGATHCRALLEAR